jgi:hypothetical protein
MLSERERDLLALVGDYDRAITARQEERMAVYDRLQREVRDIQFQAQKEIDAILNRPETGIHGGAAQTGGHRPASRASSRPDGPRNRRREAPHRRKQRAGRGLRGIRLWPGSETPPHTGHKQCGGVLMRHLA